MNLYMSVIMIYDSKMFFVLGWRRELVERSNSNSSVRADVYYFSPSGKKLRSSNEVNDYCK